ncbi:MAG: hypothetical protein ULS35scaffold63_6 [Phage 33_17]|nr:MAG: hypothetical protein ULS35scaffold63_6 [Phage 33_17]
MSSIVTLPSASENAVTNQQKFTQSWFMFLQDIWRAVRRNLGIKLGGTVNINTAAIYNTGTVESDLMTYDIGANTLVNNGDYIEVVAWGTLADNNNQKMIKLWWGDQIIYDTDSNVANGGTWQFKATIIRINDDTQEICTEMLSNCPELQDDGNYPVIRELGEEDLTLPITIKCTGEGEEDNDIIQLAMIVKLFPYN